MGEDPAGIPCQVNEKIELFGGEMNFAVTDANIARGSIDAKVSHGNQ